MDGSNTDDSDNERMPKYKKFRGDLLNKEYEFKLGMKFNSLVDFRDDIGDWSILNDREITFVKNESYRLRMECRSKSNFFRTL